MILYPFAFKKCLASLTVFRVLYMTCRNHSFSICLACAAFQAPLWTRGYGSGPHAGPWGLWETSSAYMSAWLPVQECFEKRLKHVKVCRGAGGVLRAGLFEEAQCECLQKRQLE